MTSLCPLHSSFDGILVTGYLVCVGTTMAVDRNIYFYVHTQTRIALHVSYLSVCLFVCPYLSRV